MGRSKGTVAVLALLLSVLFSAIDVPANRGAAGSRPSAALQKDAGKSGALLRTGNRFQDEERRGDGPLVLRGGAGVETALLSRRDAGGFHGGQAAPAATRFTLAYRARAPPAAA